MSTAGASSSCTTSMTKTSTRPLLRAARTSNASSHDGVDDLPRGIRCEYPSKFCNNHKAHKEKGGLHKFCDFHREKANQNQKRWQQRRRDARDQQRLKNSTRSSAAATTNVSIKNVSVSSPTDFIDPFPVSDFSMVTAPATPPHYAYTTQVYAPPVSFMAGLDPAFQFPFAFPESEHVDLVSQSMFNDPSMGTFPSVNWAFSKMDPGFEPLTVTGLGGAIV